MEILKKCALPQDRYYIFTCSECKSSIRAKGSEAIDVVGGQYRFHCPVCNVLNLVHKANGRMENE